MQERRVLIIDDHEATVEFICDSLIASGLLITCFPVIVNQATKLLGVVDLMHCNRIDTVITDFEMPIFSGLDLLRAIESDEILSHQVDLRILQTGVLNNEIALNSFCLRALPQNKPLSVTQLLNIFRQLG